MFRVQRSFFLFFLFNVKKSSKRCPGPLGAGVSKEAWETLSLTRVFSKNLFVFFYRNKNTQDTDTVYRISSGDSIVFRVTGRVALLPSPSQRERHMTKSHAIVHAVGYQGTLRPHTLPLEHRLS